MIASTAKHNLSTVGDRTRREQASWWAWFASLAAVSVLVSMQMLKGGPTLGMIAWLCSLAGAVAVFYRPRLGLYLIAGFTLVGDGALLYWYPFTKNLSSAESIMYAGRALSLSPLELFVALTLISWLGRALVRRKLEWRGGPLLLAALALSGFVAFGLAWGVSHGGNMTIALWEVRGVFLLPCMLVLATNLLERPEHVKRLFWFIAVALLVKCVVALNYVASELQFNLSGVESIAEHSFSIHMDSLVVLAAASWLYGSSPVRRLVLTPMLPLVLFGLFANQRRAAFVTLALALLLLAALLYVQNRRAFWMVVPVAAFVALAYLGAFWNAAGALGMPARAIKSAVVPSAANARDDASNVYRVLENINTMFTIKAAPLTGIGFGSKFFRVVSLPDISFFVFYEYITHNSVMWVWMQIGVGGFFALLFLIARTVMLGARAAVTLADRDLQTIAATAMLYVMMHFVYAYVDMSWDSANMVYIGIAMGVINYLSTARQDGPSPPAATAMPAGRTATRRNGAGGQ